MSLYNNWYDKVFNNNINIMYSQHYVQSKHYVQSALCTK